MPLHIGKGRTVAEAITDSIDYLQDPEKTQKGELVTSYECDPRTADNEFLLSKRQYFIVTGRDQGDRDVIAYHIRQSFRPGEITADLANKIGYELVKHFTKGKHAFIVATHTDKSHLHNHIYFNSTTLDCTRKFRNFIGSAFAVRRISDRICLEHGLSVVDNPKPSRGHYGKWLGDNKPLSNKEKLRQTIDKVLAEKPDDLNAFFSGMVVRGYEYKRGKYLSFRAHANKKFTRCRENVLGVDYTEEAIIDRIAGRRTSPVLRGGELESVPEKINLLIDIQLRLKAGKGLGYERWAKVFNLKQAAQTINYLQEHGILGYNELAEKTSEVVTRFNSLSDRMKALEESLKDNAQLQKHIINYSKTRKTYVEYRKAGYSKRFKETHEADILLHQTAKKAFNELSLSKLPTVSSLRTAYAKTLEEKKKIYSEYHTARDEMKRLLVVKANVDQLLDVPKHQADREPDSPAL